MIKISDPKDCCGCTACESICPKDAITMQPDSLGFLYPSVDESICVECGLCENVCSFNDHYDTSRNLKEPIAYAARHKDISEIMKSRSGAAFVALSDYVLNQGGVVYGAGYTDHFRVVHKRATNKEQRDEFRGSKYVQSDLPGVFRQVRKDLKDGFLVIFSGTPCQTSGLSSFIGNKYRDNLLLVDIVCHGVPGPFVWRDYLNYLENKVGKKITHVDFRDKKNFGWTAHKESFVFDNTIVHTFPYTFYKRIMFRHSCGVCHFCNTKRPSDITIADFWGWQKTDAEINKDDKGCSLILVNTEKGEHTFENIRSLLNIVPAKLSDCLQPNLQNPSAIHPQRDQFEEDYHQYGFLKTMRKYAMMGPLYYFSKVKTWIRRKCDGFKKRLRNFIS